MEVDVSEIEYPEPPECPKDGPKMVDVSTPISPEAKAMAEQIEELLSSVATEFDVSDLVKRLDDWEVASTVLPPGRDSHQAACSLMREAAAEIERLTTALSTATALLANHACRCDEVQFRCAEYPDCKAWKAREFIGAPYPAGRAMIGKQENS
jgi:hypothetical protein